ncbi:MAG: T9SS type A sorting domain-containing protein [bacterium]|nr:T9SS type A sorting domain-containing protein [bacterium]
MIILTSFLLLISSMHSKELMQLKNLKTQGIKHSKFAAEKFEKLYQQQPKLQYYMQPSKRDLLKKLRDGKVKGKGKAGVDTLFILAIRAEFQTDTSSLTTGNGLMDLDHNEFPYDSLGSTTNGYRFIYNDQETGKEVWDTPFDVNGHNTFYDPPHTKRYFEHLMESLQNYWWTVSEHTLWLEFKVVPDGESASYKLPYSLLYYGEPMDFERGLLTLFKDAVTTCDKESPEINFSKYSGDSGAVIVFHAGGCWQTDYMGDSPYDIPAAFISNVGSYFSTPVWVDNQTVAINEGILYPQTSFQDGVYSFLQGGLAHEMGHQLGLWDLYDTEGQTIGIGGWDLMGTGNWNLDGMVPPYINAFNSEKLGFISPTLLNKDTTVSILWRGGVVGNSVPKVYNIPINTGEHYLVEERLVSYPSKDTIFKDTIYSADSSLHLDSSSVRVWKDGVMTWFYDYDFGLPPDSGCGGLAIWHIDGNKISQDSAMNTVNAGFPKGVDMEEADGIQDFETSLRSVVDGEAAFYGTKYDVFYKGNSIDTIAEFTPYTSPNTDDNIGGISNIFVENISSPDSVMNFSIKFDNKLSGFPVNCGTYFDVNSPTAIEVNGKIRIFCALVDTIRKMVSVLALNPDGSTFWTRTISAPFPYIWASPAIGDIDGNDTLDVVITPFFTTNVSKDTKMKISRTESKSKSFTKIEGRIYAWNVYGKSILTKFNVTKGEIASTPLMADINGDGKQEAIFGSNDGMLYAFNNTGMITGYPKNLYQPTYATPVYDSASNTLYTTTFDGRLWAMGPDTTTKWIALKPFISPSTCSPVVCDLNNDGRKEIILGTGERKIYCISDSGKVLWSKDIQEMPFYSSPVIADIDLDSFPDIIITLENKIYGFNNLGANLTGFPINTGASGDLWGAPVIGDINNDKKPEIVIGTPDGKVIAYSNRGKMLSDFPLATGGGIYCSPMLCDINEDNNLDIFIGSDDGNLYGWSLGQYGNLQWPEFHLNSVNNRILEWNYSSAPIAENIFMNKELFIYPNPIISSGYVRYFSGNVDKVDIKIINLAGRIVKELSGKIGNNYQDVLLPELPFGVYICRVEVDISGKKYTRFKKFAVAK